MIDLAAIEARANDPLADSILVLRYDVFALVARIRELEAGVEAAYREGWRDGMHEAPTDMTRAGKIEDHWLWSDAAKLIHTEAL